MVLDITHAPHVAHRANIPLQPHAMHQRVWCQTCGMGMQTRLRVCASRTHEFPAKMLHSTPSHRLAFESEKIIDIHNWVHRVQYMTIDSVTDLHFFSFFLLLTSVL